MNDLGYPNCTNTHTQMWWDAQIEPDLLKSKSKTAPTSYQYIIFLTLNYLLWAKKGFKEKEQQSFFRQSEIWKKKIMNA